MLLLKSTTVKNCGQETDWAEAQGPESLGQLSIDAWPCRPTRPTSKIEDLIIEKHF